MATAAGVAAAVHFYQRIDEEIRRETEKQFSQHYAKVGLNVQVRSAQRVEGKGIRLFDVRVVEPGVEEPRATLFSCEEVFVECSTDLQMLAARTLDVHRVLVRKPCIHATRQPDGSFSSSKLLPPPSVGENTPVVVVEDGTFKIFDPLKCPAAGFTLRDINLTSTPRRESPTAADIREVQGSLLGDHVQKVDFQGRIDARTFAHAFTGHLEGLDVSPELRASLPASLGAKLTALGEFRGRMELNFSVNHDPAAIEPYQFDLAGTLANGRLDDSRLPHSLNDIRATVHVSNAGIAVDDLYAKGNQATLTIKSFRKTGFESNGPMSLSGEIRQFVLDRQVCAILPESLQERWRKIWPSGEINADFQADFDGQTWHAKDLSVECVKVSFSHKRFPYQLEYGNGKVDLKDDVLTIGLTAYAGSQPVSLGAEIRHPEANATGWFEVKADDVPLDKTLLDALGRVNEDTQKVVESLGLRGSVGVLARLEGREASEPWHQRLVITPNRCELCYRGFPYSVTNISGRVEKNDQIWTFSNLEGDHNTARIGCNGSLSPGLQGNELLLDFVGLEVPLDDALCNALTPNNPSIQQVWQSLRPRGAVDLSARLQYWLEKKQSSIGVEVRPKPESTSIDPIQFPYRLDKLQGVMRYRDGHVTLEKCKAVHGNVKCAYDGQCDFAPDGRWAMRFTNLGIERLSPDRELLQALPERMKRAIETLKLTAPMNLNGSMAFFHDGGVDTPLQIQWNVRTLLQQATLQCSDIPLTNIHGDVTLVGGYDGRQPLGRQTQVRGQLNLASVNYKDVQFTNVQGPLWIDDGRVLFGEWVDKENASLPANGPTGPPQTPRPLTANVLGGAFCGTGWVTFGGVEPVYGMDLTLTNADLARCAQELASTRHRVFGRVTAYAELKGAGRTRNTLSGKGRIRVTDAYVYELPVMMQLLKLLSIRMPDSNAFSTATIDYRIDGNWVYFNRIDFKGDAVSLLGKGQMNAQTEIDLDFYTKLGRGDWDKDIPVVPELLTVLSKQLMRIHVSGTLQDPRSQRQALPVLDQLFLKQLRELRIQ